MINEKTTEEPSKVIKSCDEQYQDVQVSIRKTYVLNNQDNQGEYDENNILSQFPRKFMVAESMIIEAELETNES